MYVYVCMCISGSLGADGNTRYISICIYTYVYLVFMYI